MPVVKVQHNGQTYNCIAAPDKIEYVERDDFIKSLLMKATPPEMPLEDAVLKIRANMESYNFDGKFKVSAATAALAKDYIKYRKRGARLPKFSRWAAGMFKDDAALAGDLAMAGKWEEKSGDIVISGDVMDLLRNADTHHFSSCLKAGGVYEDVTKGIVTDHSGIAIAYVDDENGRMRGRVWVHHAQRADTGADVAVVCQKWGGTLEARQVVDLLRDKGHEAYVGGAYGRQGDGIYVNFVNCFTTNIHHDMYTWVKNFRVNAE